MAAKTIITWENLGLYDQLLKEFVSKEDAKSIKTAAISADGKKLLLYRVPEPVGVTAPAYEIEFPETDITGLMQKVVGSTEGDVLVAKSDGNAKDSGVKLGDLAIKTEVAQQIAAAVANSGHITKKIVTKVPTAAEAKENVIYMLKVEGTTGSDKYQEYQLIGGEVVMTGDTSVDLTDYAKLNDVLAKIAAAKSEAIAAAKNYTDAEITKVNETTGTLQGKVTANANDITNLKASVKTNADNITANTTKITANTSKLTALQGLVGDGFQAATEAQIRSLFS